MEGQEVTQGGLAQLLKLVLRRVGRYLKEIEMNQKPTLTLARPSNSDEDTLRTLLTLFEQLVKRKATAEEIQQGRDEYFRRKQLKAA